MSGWQNGSDSQHRKAIKERKEMDNYTCMFCDRDAEYWGKELITAHHLIKKELGGEPIPENMITLCRECHDKVHSPDSELEKEVIG